MHHVVSLLGLAMLSITGSTPSSGQTIVPAPEATPSIIGQATVPARIRLQIGTEVPLILDQALSSQHNIKGDLVHLTVAHDVTAEGRVVIAKGTRAVGELIRAERKSGMGVAGKLEAQLLYLERNGQFVRLSGRLAAHGEGGATAAMMTAVAIGGIALVITGKSAIIPAGTQMDAVLDRDVWVTVP